MKTDTNPYDVAADPFGADDTVPTTHPVDLDPEAAETLRTVAPRFRLYDLDDLANLPEPTWLVRDILPAESFAVLYGVSGCGKSFLSLDMALCIAAGVPWQGRTVRQGAVAYLAGEGVRGLNKRIRAWLVEHPDADVKQVRRNFHVIPQAVQLLRDGHANALFNTLEEIKDLRLVVVDTWARSLVGGDENSAKDSGIAVDVLDRIKVRLGATTLVIHHTGKDGTAERGSGSLRGAADAMLLLKPIPAAGQVSLICDKAKDSVPFSQIHLRLEQVGESAVFRAGATAGVPAPAGGSTFGVRTQWTPNHDGRPF
jgi:hypothetical protein